LVFDPTDDLLAETAYSLNIAGTAVGTAGDALDGDGDGTGGDAFSLSFTSGFPDATAPRIAAVYPANNSTDIERLPHLTLTYTEPLAPGSVDGRVSLVPLSGGAAHPGSVQYQRLGESSAISFFADEPLAANTTFRLVVAPGLRDLFFNEQTLEQRLTFTTGPQTAVPMVMDAFEGDVRDDWWEPQQSGSTIGIVTDSTSSVGTDELASGLYGGSRSFRIDYGWNLNDSAWLIRQYRNLSPGGGARTFTSSATVRAAVFGDGSGTLFRFAARDAGPSPNIEVSPWVAVDWVGWRDITWDIDVDGTGSWISPNGTVDGNAYIDSIQLSYDPTAPSAQYGQIWVDDLQLVDFVSTAGGESPEAAPLALGEAFPNPVRTRATVRFSLAAPSEVTAVVYSAPGAEVARLASGETRAAGAHALEWDASAVAAGVYFVRVTAAGETETARVTVVR
ncbi:MAG: Ig-like domain-containing protein, partial [Bacteroidota bacterium]